jgi:tetratricopeptide (TPR) repeat protein
VPTRWRWALCLVALGVGAFAWRIGYVARLGSSVLGESLSEDAVIYWRWAAYLLNHGFWGKHPFFHAPLYPYVLAPLRAAFGDSVPSILWVQALWGATSVVLLADAARRLTRPAIGMFVGVVAALYETAVFFDGLVLTESLLFFLESLLLWSVVRSDKASPRAAGALVVAGSLIGLLAEGRATSALLLLPAWAFLAYRRGMPTRDQVVRGGALLAGFLMVALPPAFRNHRVSGEWIPFTYNGGFNLYVGNNPAATGNYTVITGTHVQGAAVGTGEDGGNEADGREYLRQAEGVDLGPNASSAHWARKAWRFAMENPGRVARLSARKIGMMWNRREYPQIENVDEFRTVAGPLGLPIVGGFGFIGPLALAGLVFAWRRGQAARFVAGCALVVTLATAPFFVTDRYRHQLIPAALLLAGLPIEEAATTWARNRGRGGGRVAVALMAGALIVNLPAPELSRGKYEWSLAFDLGTRWAERGRDDLAIAEYQRALAMEQGGSLRGLGASERGDLYYNYGNALLRSGRRMDAATWYERAVRVAPDHALAVRARADAYAWVGKSERAESLYAALESKAGGRLLALAGRGRLAASAGRLDVAERLFREVVSANPAEPGAWGDLVRVQIQAHRLSEARATLEEARRAGLPRPELRAHEALLDALGGDVAGAERALADVPREALARDPALAEVVGLTRSLLDRSRR